MTRRGLAVAIALAFATAMGGAWPGSGGAVAQAVPREQRLYMITDSVGLGAEFAMPRAFPGWQFTLDGDPGEFTETLEHKYVAPRLSTTPGVFGDHAIVAAGYNYPYWDQARFDRSVDSMVATLEAAGVKYVHWVTLREVKPQFVSASGWRQIQPYSWYFPEVNERLELALERHPNLFLVDWAAVADQPGLTYDAIHLNPVGSALYSRIAAESVANATTAVRDGSVTRVRVPDSAGVGAVAVNVTITGARTAGYLTAWNCDGSAPTASFHNSVRADIVAHATIVPLNASGEFCLATRVATNLVVDLTGRFPADAGYRALGPTRWVDTRSGGNRLASGGSLVLDLDTVAGIGPSQVGAVAISVTAVGAAGPGYLVASAPCADQVETSNVNYLGRDTIPNLVIVEPDASGQVCITALTATDVLVDVLGVFDADTDVSAGDPHRLFDSREVGIGDVVAGGSEIRLRVADAGVAPGAHGVVVNLTAVGARSPGYAAAYPCASGRPAASQVNMPDARAASNAGIVAPDTNGEICVFTSASAHLIVDVMGSVGPAFIGAAPTRLLDTRAPSG